MSNRPICTPVRRSDTIINHGDRKTRIRFTYGRIWTKIVRKDQRKMNLTMKDEFNYVIDL